LGAEDSGDDTRTVVWRSVPGRTVSLVGSRAIAGARLVRDPELEARLPPGARGRVAELDLRAQGLTDYGDVTQRGNPGMELFVAGARMELSRWPAEGWLRIADVPQQQGKLLNEGLEREKRYDGVPVGRHFGTIRYDGDRPASWREHRGILLHGYWTWDWNDSFQTISRIDTATRTIAMAEPHHSYGYTKNQRFAFLNIIEELSRPGTWCMDRQRGLLWFWPPEGWDGAEVRVSMLEDPLLVLRGCRNVRIQGLRFAESRGNGVRIDGGRHNLLAGCVFTHLGGDAATVSGEHNGVQSCDIVDVSSGGIMLEGGDRKTLAPGRNYARNNHIRAFSRWVRTYKHAISVEGVGQHVAHNVMHEAPQEAMYFRGNDHLMFISCAPSVHVDARGTSWAAYYFDGTYPVLTTALEAVHGREPPYAERYPELRTILDQNPAIPEGNRVLRNVSWGGRWLDLHDRVTMGLLTLEGNVISDPDLGSQLAPEYSGPDDYFLNGDSPAHRKSYAFGDPWLTAELERRGNVLQVEPALRVDLEGRRIEMPAGSAAARVGFEPIAFAEIGLEVDEYRPHGFRADGGPVP
jgi:hypothetical protein